MPRPIDLDDPSSGSWETDDSWFRDVEREPLVAIKRYAPTPGDDAERLWVVSGKPTASVLAGVSFNGRTRPDPLDALYNTPQIIDGHTCRPTMSDIYRAEQQIVAAHKQMYGADCEPGRVYVREAALRLLEDEAKAGKVQL